MGRLDHLEEGLLVEGVGLVRVGHHVELHQLHPELEPLTRFDLLQEHRVELVAGIDFGRVGRAAVEVGVGEGAASHEGEQQNQGTSEHLRLRRLNMSTLLYSRSDETGTREKCPERVSGES